MQLVSDVLKSKGRSVWFVRPDDTVFDSLRQMAEREVGALVVKEGDDLVGIVTERDYARKIILEGKASRTSKVSDIMTRRVLWVTEEQSVDECMALMIDKKVRHLPVLENQKVTGIVSIRDLVEAMVSEQQVIIDHLIKYITGPDYA